MATAQQDTEITLGTGRMLAIFFAFVLVCAFFFSIGFSLGRRTAAAVTSISPSPGAGTPAAIVRPSPVKSEAPPPTTTPGEMSFYKAVGEKNADTALTPPEPKPQPAAPSSGDANPKPVPDAASPASAGASYYVQVAAVSRQEDADSLVEALKKKQYPAFTASNASVDKFFHVQVGPYAELKDAEAMRARLITDGYNPIVKK